MGDSVGDFILQQIVATGKIMLDPNNPGEFIIPNKLVSPTIYSPNNACWKTWGSKRRRAGRAQAVGIGLDEIHTALRSVAAASLEAAETLLQPSTPYG